MKMLREHDNDKFCWFLCKNENLQSFDVYMVDCSGEMRREASFYEPFGFRDISARREQARTFAINLSYPYGEFLGELNLSQVVETTV